MVIIADRFQVIPIALTLYPANDHVIWVVNALHSVSLRWWASELWDIGTRVVPRDDRGINLARLGLSSAHLSL